MDSVRPRACRLAMTASDKRPLPAFGFLTIVEQADLGSIGGYLVLNAAGRPLEFHCTVPVKPNRAQEILFGRTLKPFLFGEQIGATLLGKTKLQPLLVFTDSVPALAVREFSSVPVLLVPRVPEPVVGEPAVEVAVEVGPSLLSFSLGKQTVAALSHAGTDREEALSQWLPIFDGLDLHEPFARIREAIEEAQRGARSGAAA